MSNENELPALPDNFEPESHTGSLDNAGDSWAQIPDVDSAESVEQVTETTEGTESTSENVQAGLDEQAPEDRPPHFIPEYVRTAVSVEDEVISKLTEEATRFIFGVGSTVRETIRFIQSANQVTPATPKEQLGQYETVVAGATTDTLYAHDDLQDTADRPDADWKQYVEHKGAKYRIARPPAVSAKDTDVVTGNTAQLLLEQIRGIGQTVTVPLIHSGIWLTVKSSKLSALVQLDTKLANAKVALGRSSRGYAFSNDGVITHESLFDFFLAHVVDCNVENWTPEILSTLIKAPDLPTIAQAMGVTMYPKGFPYAQACTIEADKCNHITRAKLNLTKMFWVDNNRLSPAQKARIADRRSRFTPSVVREYQDTWPEFKSSVIDLGPVRLLLKVPTMQEHLDSGHAWINDIETMTEEAFGHSLIGDARDQYMLNQGQATRLCAFSHWVKEIQMDVVSGDDVSMKTVNDADTIRNLLRDLSSEADSRNAIIDGVMTYINDMTVSIIAIPNYPCELCKKWQRNETGPFKALIPFDAINTFFSLQQFKLMEAQEKDLI